MGDPYERHRREDQRDEVGMILPGHHVLDAVPGQLGRCIRPSLEQIRRAVRIYGPSAGFPVSASTGSDLDTPDRIPVHIVVVTLRGNALDLVPVPVAQPHGRIAGLVVGSNSLAEPVAHAVGAVPVELEDVPAATAANGGKSVAGFAFSIQNLLVEKLCRRRVGHRWGRRPSLHGDHEKGQQRSQNSGDTEVSNFPSHRSVPSCSDQCRDDQFLPDRISSVSDIGNTFDQAIRR
jgi:rubredoxin